MPPRIAAPAPADDANVPVTTRSSTVTLTKRTVNVLSVSIRQYRTGVEIRLQSDVLEQWFKDNQGAALDRPVCPAGPWNGADVQGAPLKFYRLSGVSEAVSNGTVALTSGSYYRMAASDYPSLSVARDANTMNLSWLRVVGLKEGVTIKLPDTVHTNALMRRWHVAAQELATEIYRMYMKPIAYKITVTSEELV